MKTIVKTSLALGVSLLIASATGTWLARSPSVSVSPVPAPKTQTQSHTANVAPAVIPILTPIVAAVSSGTSRNIEDLRRDFAQAQTLEQLDPIAQELSEIDNAESVQVLLDGIEKIQAWPVRAALAKNLRALANPETLQTLLPALLNNYGRGNTILNEISDCIARLAQPETVEDLAALHWQASVQAGQGHKVLRTVACIRNPAAKRGLMKVAAMNDSPALVAAANEALLAMAKEQ